MSVPPKASAARAATASIAAGSDTSASTATASPPAAVIASTVSDSRSGCSPAATTRAPREASSCAVARPIPVAAPVTIAVLPATDIGGSYVAISSRAGLLPMAWRVVTLRTLVIAIALSLGAVPAAAASPAAHHDRIDRVVDGDTVRLAGLGRVRLIGVDTPEVYFKTECYGRQASNFTKRLLPPGTPVTYRFDVQHRARYGRELAYLYKGSTFVNAELVKRGYAVPLTIPPNVRYAHRFVALSRAARDAGRGLWAADACAGGGSTSTSAGDKDCSDFSTHAEAQRYYEAK